MFSGFYDEEEDYDPAGHVAPPSQPEDTNPYSISVERADSPPSYRNIVEAPDYNDGVTMRGMRNAPINNHTGVSGGASRISTLPNPDANNRPSRISEYDSEASVEV